MNIPFLRFLKRYKTEGGSVAVAPPPVVLTEKPPSERLGKTFIPHSSRIVGLESPANFPVPPSASIPTETAPAMPRRISLGGSGSVAVKSKISANAPPAERTIALTFTDLVPSIPSALLKPGPLNLEHRVLLKAAEVERGMSTGRPSVLLRAIYNQAPEFFTSEVPATDLREVLLPFDKVVDQFASFQVRDDQITGQEYPQLETPFLQVTLEDGERFGKPATLPAAKKFPAVKPAVIPEANPRVVTATPPTTRAGEPAIANVALKSKDPIGSPMPAPDNVPAPPLAAEAPPPLDQTPRIGATPPPSAAVPRPSIPLPDPASTFAPAPTIKAPIPLDQSPKAPAAAAPKPSVPFPPPVATPASPPAAAPTTKAALPLDQSSSSSPTTEKISPNGTGAPAAERVPASSGSPVPTPLPSPFAPLPPTRIPFKITPSSNDDLCESSKFPTPRPNQDAVDLASPGLRISLPLRNILRELAPFQLSGPIDAVPETAQIEIPFSIVKPQLSLGRITLSPAQFQAVLPEEYRALFKADPDGTPVPLSLQDVLQNLPGESLQLRGDQEEAELGETFETPFSRKASEDAARMKVSTGPIAKAMTTATEVTSVPAPTPPAPAPVPATKPPPTSAKPTAKVAVTPPKKASIDSAKMAPDVPARKTPKPAPLPKAEVAPVTKSTTETPAATAPTGRNAIQNVLDTDEALDAKSVVGHVSRLPGVSACAIVFSDGLSLAGNIPEEYEADALCAMAPSIMKRIDEQMFGARFGALNGLTLFCAKMPISLFVRGNICLAAIHSGGEIADEVRDRLGRITQELACMYSQQPNA